MGAFTSTSQGGGGKFVYMTDMVIGAIVLS